MGNPGFSSSTGVRRQPGARRRALSGGDRVGVFGGTFDPVHLGHLVVAEDALEVLSLDRVIFVPSGTPPHKEAAEAPARLRYRMVEESIGEEARFRVSPVEVERDGPSYTVDTLRRLTGESPGDTFFFLMGVDQWADFHRWREPLEVARLATPAVMTRQGHDSVDAHPEFPPGSVPGPQVVPVTRVDLSATAIRRRIRDGRSVRFRIPRAAHRIIESERLYR